MKIVRGRVLLIALFLIIVIAAFSVFAASNNVPPTFLSDSNTAIDYMALIPPECSSLGITAIVDSSGNVIYGSGINELILGTNGNDNITGGQGNDCIVGGGGNDTLDGEQGSDVLLGGDGNDYLDGGKKGSGAGSDTCYGGSGTNTFANCDVIHNP